MKTQKCPKICTIWLFCKSSFVLFFHPFSAVILIGHCGFSACCVNFSWQLICKWLTALTGFFFLLFSLFLCLFTVTTCWTPRSTLCCPCARTPICWTLCTASFRAWCTTRSHHASTSPPTYKVLQSTLILFATKYCALLFKTKCSYKQFR